VSDFGYEEFDLTEEHLELFKAAWVSWDPCEFGAPEIDPKRPYGNSDVVLDMAEVLGVETVETEDGEVVRAEDAKRLRELHAEMETALQVVLNAGEFTAGHYRKEKYVGRWELA